MGGGKKELYQGQAAYFTLEVGGRRKAEQPYGPMLTSVHSLDSRGDRVAAQARAGYEQDFISQQRVILVHSPSTLTPGPTLNPFSSAL